MRKPMLGGNSKSEPNILPSIRTWPFVGYMRPEISRSSIVLPEPLTPCKPIISPGLTVN